MNGTKKRFSRKCFSAMFLSLFLISGTAGAVYYDEAEADFFEHRNAERIACTNDDIVTENLPPYLEYLRAKYCTYEEGRPSPWECEEEFVLYNCSPDGDWWVEDPAECVNSFDEDDEAGSLLDLYDNVDIVVEKESGAFGVSVIFIMLLATVVSRRKLRS